MTAKVLPNLATASRIEFDDSGACRLGVQAMVQQMRCGQGAPGSSSVVVAVPVARVVDAWARDWARVAGLMLVVRSVGLDI